MFTKQKPNKYAMVTLIPSQTGIEKTSFAQIPTKAIKNWNWISKLFTNVSILLATKAKKLVTKQMPFQHTITSQTKLKNQIGVDQQSLFCFKSFQQKINQKQDWGSSSNKKL